MWATVEILDFLKAILKKVKKSENNNLSYLIQYIQNIIFQHEINIKVFIC